ncbi:MAG: DNA-deoxyinosine glycosylase [Candidatus Omnitrophica bacterium]|nr:DNA-deoxyinosine glycosylase [Candidatus Omnitrophota bacterium]
MNLRLQGLQPIIDKRTKVLILGSFPGSDSLKMKQYYAYRRNQFWEIMSDMLKKDIMSLRYNRKKEDLLQNGVGLWDVVKSCRRTGSLDEKITDCRFNDLTKLVKKYSNIRVIFLNGRKSEKLFKTGFPTLKSKVLYLPSTSPANATITLNRKIKLWRKMRTYLGSI